jgi:hypothetical protein
LAETYLGDAGFFAKSMYLLLPLPCSVVNIFSLVTSFYLIYNGKSAEAFFDIDFFIAKIPEGACIKSFILFGGFSGSARDLLKSNALSGDFSSATFRTDFGLFFGTASVINGSSTICI